MQYRQLGKWGMRVSCLGLGSYLTIGMTVDDGTSKKMIKLAVDHGVNYIDTANAYNKGEAEKTLGRLLKDYARSDLVVLTKVWAPMGEGTNDRGLSAKHIREQCEASLERLQMDYVDIYMCHRPDPETPLEETVRAMEDLARAGKILYWGISEWPASMIVRANAIAREIGARPMAVSQPRYNLLYRYPEQLLFPTTKEEGIGNVVFSPLAHGMLTGKYKPGAAPPKNSRAADDRQNAVIKNMYWKEDYMARGQAFAAIAEELGTAPATLAIAWCLRTPHVSSVILGASKIAQLKENLAAVNVKIPDDVMQQLNELYPSPQAVPQV